MIETTAAERAALFDRAAHEVADPVTHVWRNAEAEARMAELIEAQYDLPRREAQLTAHEWYGNEIARRDITVQMMMRSDEEQEEFLRFCERLRVYWDQHPEIPNLTAAEEAYRQAESDKFSAVCSAFLCDGDMRLLYHDTALAEDFRAGLHSSSALHWAVVSRALVNKAITGVTAATLAQPNSFVREVVLQAVDDATNQAYEQREETGEDGEVVDAAQSFADKYAGDTVQVMEFSAAEQREQLADYAAWQAYQQEVVMPEIEKRLSQASPDGTFRLEDAIAEHKRLLEAAPDTPKHLVDATLIEYMRVGRLAHTLTLEPDGYIAEWGAFGVGNREAEAEGTVYEVLKG